jgi:hypothetical protein
MIIAACCCAALGAPLAASAGAASPAAGEHFELFDAGKAVAQVLKLESITQPVTGTTKRSGKTKPAQMTLELPSSEKSVVKRWCRSFR